MQHAAAPALSRAPQNKRQLKTESNYKLKKTLLCYWRKTTKIKSEQKKKLIKNGLRIRIC